MKRVFQRLESFIGFLQKLQSYKNIQILYKIGHIQGKMPQSVSHHNILTFIFEIFSPVHHVVCDSMRSSHCKTVWDNVYPLADCLHHRVLLSEV